MLFPAMLVFFPAFLCLTRSTISIISSTSKYSKITLPLVSSYSSGSFKSNSELFSYLILSLPLLFKISFFILTFSPMLFLYFYISFFLFFSSNVEIVFIFFSCVEYVFFYLMIMLSPGFSRYGKRKLLFYNIHVHISKHRLLQSWSKAFCIL